MIQEIIIEKINRESKTSKAGKPYQTLSVQTGGVWYNGFSNKASENWKEGDTVKADLYEEEYNGKVYKKVKAPAEIDFVKDRLEKFADWATKVEERLKTLESK